MTEDEQEDDSVSPIDRLMALYYRAPAAEEEPLDLEDDSDESE